MTLAVSETNDLDEVLRERFGFTAFRPGQREAIETLIRDKRVLCIYPTGHGKSLIYQLPALLWDGLTLVISPLLALMRDQIDHLHHRFDIPSAAINSDQSDAENARVRQRVADGALRLLFVAPEQLESPETSALLDSVRIAFTVVDEAHCISTWGHDFRPAYRAILPALTRFRVKNPALRVLGLTATADQRTEADIAAQLALPDTKPLQVIRESMDRPNLSLGVVPVTGMAVKLAYLAELVANQSGCGILYCATRDTCEIVAAYLRHRGLDARAYHAGLEAEEKRRLQTAFVAGRHRVIAATNALGMGIDKGDVRYIVHVELPGSVTAYYQEVGRAGRDGEPARGVLLFDPEDQRIQAYFINAALPDPSDFVKVREALGVDGRPAPKSVTALRMATGLHPTRVNVVLSELLEQGFVVRDNYLYRNTDAAGTPDLERFQRMHAARRRELDAMVRFGNREVCCLMQSLRQALGDTRAEPCGRCSLCRTEAWPLALPDATEAAAWLEAQPVALRARRKPAMAEGLALLNGDVRTDCFQRFMRQRAAKGVTELEPALVDRLHRSVTRLAERHAFASVVMIPSRTWAQRRAVADLIGEILGVPVMLDAVGLRDADRPRQGTLCNNEQRRRNVADSFQLVGGLHQGGAVLLVDDYIGSGATLTEVARLLRACGGIEGAIVPLVMARIRWRQGRPGMV